MYVPNFCPHCGGASLESRCDAVSRCRSCDHVFVVLDLEQVVKLHQTPAQIFMDKVVNALGDATSAAYVALRKGGDA